MAITGDGYKLTHVSIRGGAPLNEMLHIDLHKQLSVLYGLNGSGKTRILRAVVEALSGHQERTTRADLHLQVDVARKPTRGFLRDFSGTLSEALKEIRAEMYTSSNFSEYDILYEEPRTPDKDWSIAEKLYALVELHAAQRGLSNSDKEILHGVTANGRFALQAGRDGQRTLWLAARPSDNAGLAESLGIEARLDDMVRGLDEQIPDARLFSSHPLIDTINAFQYLLSQSSRDTKSPRISKLRDTTLPLIRLGTTPSLQPASLIDGLSNDTDLNLATLRSATWRGRYHAKVYSDNGTIADDVKAAISAVENTCNAHLAEVLVFPPRLRFNVPNPNSLLYDERPSWEFETGASWVPITELSSAQSRWARLAISLAVADRDDRPTIFLCDEPERGLHRLAEQRVSDGLAQLVTRAQTGIIAATHSPLIVGNPAAQRVLTYRDSESNTALRPWRLAITDSIDAELAGIDMGLAFGDLLQLMNVAVVVEGLHDEYVVKSLLGRQLDQASAGIFSMRGAARAKSLAEAKILFQATNGPILVVLDGLCHSQVGPLWESILAADRHEEHDLAFSLIGRLSTLGPQEAEFLAELAKSAIEMRTLHRIDVYGLSLPDIICYLPEEFMLEPAENSWQSVFEQWATDANGKDPRNIKGFLKRKRLLPQDGAELNDRVHRAAIDAARTMAIVHPDLIALGEKIVGLAEHRGGWPQS